MKKFFKVLLKILKWTSIILASLIIVFLIVRFIGQKVNNKTPDGGINETMYVDINGSKQWINIYGQDKDNPVLLYLHGGPGDSTSFGDYKILRKLSDVYTVVNWDQRDCGKSWTEEQNGTKVTYDQLMSDGREMTKFLREHLGKDKITLMGMSWGSTFGANLVLDEPEYYDAYIGLSFYIDEIEVLSAFKEKALEDTKNDPELHKIAESIITEQAVFDSMSTDERIDAALSWDPLFDKMIGTESYFSGDLNLLSAAVFNPYYSISDFYNVFVKASPQSIDELREYPYSELVAYGNRKSVSLSGRYDYEVPFYIIIGDRDYTVMPSVVQDYYSKVNAPDKGYYEVEGGHFMPMLRSERLSEIIHEIAEKQK